jgi:hypothetical protein
MRSAYSGRAAAYQKKGNHEKALADCNMVVTYYGIEVEILNNLEAPDRDKLLLEAAEAYLVRSKCLETVGRLEDAALDRNRAETLRATATRIASESPDRPSSARSAQLVNNWVGAVTVVVGGVTYQVEVGERKLIPVSGDSVTCQIQAGPHLRSSTLQAGKTYTIR